MLFLICFLLSNISRLLILIIPSVPSSSPIRDLSKVDFPLPLGPIILTTSDLFIDITIDKEFLILQYKTYPKYYIVRRIQENEFFYNDIIKDDIVCYRFRLKTNDQKADFSIMQTNGTQFCTKEFILSMAILWKDYLDSSFYDTIF